MTSKLQQHRKACAGKVAHRSQEDAYAARKQHERVHGERLQVYRCPFGHHYHLGHSGLSEKRNRKNWRELPHKG